MKQKNLLMIAMEQCSLAPLASLHQSFPVNPVIFSYFLQDRPAKLMAIV